MQFRKATYGDIDRLLEVYAIARTFMRSSGNEEQWAGGYPQREIIEADIVAGNLYVGEQGGITRCVFALIGGSDPTYLEIEDGAWLNEEPYAAIHRVASDGSKRSTFAEISDFCKSGHDNLRIDTHADNIPMQRAVERAGFAHCGTIHLANGDPRLAYQWRR